MTNVIAHKDAMFLGSMKKARTMHRCYLPVYYSFNVSDLVFEAIEWD